MAQKKPGVYERGFPLGTIIITNLITLAVYGAGAYLFFQFGLFWGTMFLLYLLYMEASTFREGCRYCFYYGKRCAFGRGVIASWFIKRGDPKKFCERELTIKDFIPHMFIAFLPIIPGTLILLSGFSWLVLGLMALPIIVNFAGNPVIYGRLACPHCNQGSICCPACEYFMKKEKRKNG